MITNFMKKAETLLEAVDEKVKDSVENTPAATEKRRPVILNDDEDDEDDGFYDDEPDTRINDVDLIVARENQERTERLIQEAREAMAAQKRNESEKEERGKKELEEKLKSTKSEVVDLQRAIEDLREKEKDMQREKEGLFNRITSLQSVLELKEMEVKKMSNEVKTLQTRLERSKDVLEAKDSLIESLKKNNNTNNDADESVENVHLIASKTEINSLKTQIMDLNSAIGELKVDLDESEQRSGQIRASLTERWELCQREMEMENNRRKTSEAETRGLRSELRLEKDVIRGLRAENDDLKNEIERLKLSSKKKQTFTYEVNEAENRLKKLTEALLAKQNMIDQLNSERKSLKLALNASKKNERDLFEEDFLNNYQQKSEETKEMSVTPIASVFPRRFYSIASKGDLLYSQTVSYLNKSPKIRLLLLMYCILIHILWLRR